MLDRSKIDRDYLEIRTEPHPWDFVESTMVRDDWEKWGKARYLERLLLATSIARTMGGTIQSLHWNKRLGPDDNQDEAEMLGGKLRLNPSIEDTYPTMRKVAGKAVWPATTQLRILTCADPDASSRRGIWQVNWQLGNMPRKPVAWEQWSASVLVGADPATRHTRVQYDWAERTKQNKALEEKKRRDEIQSARQEAESKVHSPRAVCRPPQPARHHSSAPLLPTGARRNGSVQEGRRR